MKTQEEIERSRDLIRSTLAKRAPRVAVVLVIIVVLICGCLIYSLRSDRNYQRMTEDYTVEKLRTEEAILRQKKKATECAQELTLVTKELQECSLKKTGTN